MIIMSIDILTTKTTYKTLQKYKYVVINYQTHQIFCYF